MPDAPSATMPSTHAATAGGESTSVPTTRLPESRVLSEVFLSPRVIDREAFNDYAGSLRQLIEQAVRETEGLRAAATDAQVAREALREVAGKTQPKLEAAARVMATIDARANEAEGLLKSSREAAATLDGMKAEAERSIREQVTGLEVRLAALDQRIDEQMRLAEQKAAQIAAAYEERLRTKIAEMESRHAGYGTTIDTLAILIARAETLLETGGQPGQTLTSVADLVARGERVQQQAETSLRGLEAVRDGADRTRLESAATLAEAGRKLDELGRAAETLRVGLAATIAETEQARTAAVARCEEIRAALSEPAAEADERARALQARLEEAGRVAGQAGAGATAVVERLASLLDELRPWRSILLEERADGELPGALGAVVDRLRADLAGDLSQITAAMQGVLGKARR